MQQHLLKVGVCLAVSTVPAMAQVARVSHSDSTVMPEARTVLLEDVNVPGHALIIVRAVRNDRIDPTPLGQVRIGPGETANVRVRLTREARPGESFIVMLHADFGRRGLDQGDPVVLSIDIPENVLRGARSPRQAASR